MGVLTMLLYMSLLISLLVIPDNIISNKNILNIKNGDPVLRPDSHISQEEYGENYDDYNDYDGDENNYSGPISWESHEGGQDDSQDYVDLASILERKRR